MTRVYQDMLPFPLLSNTPYKYTIWRRLIQRPSHISRVDYARLTALLKNRIIMKLGSFQTRTKYRTLNALNRIFY